MTSNTEPQRRKIRAPEKYKEDGTYYTGPKDPKHYFNNYYHTKLATEEQCRYCNESIRKSYMNKHQKTKKCRIQYDQMAMTLQCLGDAVDDFVQSSGPELGENRL